MKEPHSHFTAFVGVPPLITSYMLAPVLGTGSFKVVKSAKQIVVPLKLLAIFLYMKLLSMSWQLQE